MDTEIHTFVQIWLTAAVSLIFTHQIAARISPGAPRLLSLLPVVYLFTTIPFRLTSIHLGSPTFFYLVWLGNFKLLLFSFDQGPLAAASPPLSLLQFAAIGILPINPSREKDDKTLNSLRLFPKFVLLVAVIGVYGYREALNQYLIYFLYCCHVYLGVELILAVTAAPVRWILGFDLDPQFNEPYLATSLQDFWGRRWNLMVPAILRPAVYLPVRRISTPLLGGRFAVLTATVAAFLVSGLMHELIYYYLSRAAPTWEVTGFFFLHGVCVAVEVALKKAGVRGGWLLPAAVSRVLTVGFVAATGAWLFFPQVVRNGVDLKAIDEYTIIVDFLKNNIGSNPLLKKISWMVLN